MKMKFVLTVCLFLSMACSANAAPIGNNLWLSFDGQPLAEVEIGNPATLDVFADFEDLTIGGGLQICWDEMLTNNPINWIWGPTIPLNGLQTYSLKNEQGVMIHSVTIGDFDGLVLNETLIGSLKFFPEVPGPFIFDLAVDSQNGPFSDMMGSPLQVSCYGAALQVVNPSAVPLPGAIWLLGSGFGVLFYRKHNA